MVQIFHSGYTCSVDPLCQGTGKYIYIYIYIYMYNIANEIPLDIAPKQFYE